MQRGMQRTASSCSVGEAGHRAIFGTRTRFVMLVLVLLCLSSVWSNILAFNFAIICMAPNNETAHDDVNDTYEFPAQQRMWTMSSVAAAGIIGNFIMVPLIGRFQIRTVFALFGMVSAIVTLLLPTAVRSGFGWLVAVRAVQGLTFSTTLPVIGAFSAKWTYFKQHGLFVASLVAYLQLAPAITMPVSGYLCTSFHWPSVFYAHGTACIILFALYFLMYRNSPQSHPLVGRVELGKIEFGKPPIDKTRTLPPTPYRAIMTSSQVWAVWIASFGNFTAVNLMFLYNPIVLSQILGFSVHSTGITAALPPLAQFSMKLLCGFLSDKIKFLEERTKFRMFNTIALMGGAFFLVLTAILLDINATLAMLALGAAAGAIGANTGGFFKNASVISGRYGPFVTGNVSLGITVTMFFLPFLVGFVGTDTAAQWRIIYITAAAVMCLCNIFFVVFCGEKPAEWTKDSWPGNTAHVADQNHNNPVRTINLPSP